MKIDLDRRHKTAYLWLTNAEHNNPQCMEQMEKTASALRAQKYHITIFYSGKKDLYDGLERLLLANRMIMNPDESAKPNGLLQENMIY